MVVKLCETTFQSGIRKTASMKIVAGATNMIDKR